MEINECKSEPLMLAQHQDEHTMGEKKTNSWKRKKGFHVHSAEKYPHWKALSPEKYLQWTYVK